MKTINLAIGAGLFSVVIAAQSSIRRMKSTDLDEEDTKKFLDCIKATGKQYEISVDDGGAIVVVPAENRDLDLDGTDLELVKCAVEATHTMQVALGGTGDGREEYRDAKSVQEVDYQSLVKAGAKGQTREDNDNVATFRASVSPWTDVDYCGVQLLTTMIELARSTIATMKPTIAW